MEIRRVRADEMSQAIKLADDTFVSSEQISMGRAFPQVFSTDLSQSYGAFDGKRLVSFMGLVPAQIRVKQAIIQVFSLGAVCTHRDYRNQGIATKLLHTILNHVKKADGSLLFISGDRGLYTRNHCYHFGETCNYKIDEPTNPSYLTGNTRSVKSTDIFAINQLRQAENIRFMSSIWHWQQLIEAKQLRLFVYETDNKVISYVVIKIPVSQNMNTSVSTVADWGGNLEGVLAIFHDLIKGKIVSAIDVVVPWYDELNNYLTEFQANRQHNDGTLNIVNPNLLMEELMPYLIEKDITLAKQLTIDMTNDSIILKLGNKATSLSQEEFVKLLFHPSWSKNTAFETLFPIPLPNTVGIFYV